MRLFSKGQNKNPLPDYNVYTTRSAAAAAAVFSFLSSGSSLLRPIFIRIWIVSTTLLCAAVVYSFRSVIGKQNAPLLSALGQRSALRLCIQDIRRCRWIGGACSINRIKRREIFRKHSVRNHYGFRRGGIQKFLSAPESVDRHRGRVRLYDGGYFDPNICFNMRTDMNAEHIMSSPKSRRFPYRRNDSKWERQKGV